MKPIRVVIADDFELWRRAVRLLLSEDPDVEVVCESADGLDAVEKSKALQPDVLLLDLQMPKMDGLEVARHISTVSPATKILFLSSNPCLEVIQECLKISFGYVLKGNAAIELMPMLRSIILKDA